MSALGFAEVDDIVSYITNSFHSREEASSYLIELLGIPAERAGHISGRLFLAESPAATFKTVDASPKQNNLDHHAAADMYLKSGKKSMNGASEMLNNAFIINCLRCGRIEHKGSRFCDFCDSELHYEADLNRPNKLVQQHMNMPVALDDEEAQPPRMLDAEQVAKSKAQRSSGESHIMAGFYFDKQQCVDDNITRNEQLPKDARQVVDCVLRKMCQNKRGSSGLKEHPEVFNGIQNALVVVDDFYNLVFV